MTHFPVFPADERVGFFPAGRTEAVNAYYNRGIAYADKGDYDKAIADYSEALRLAPDCAYVYDRGNIYYCMGD